MATTQDRTGSTLWIVASGLLAVLVHLVLPDGQLRDVAFIGIVSAALAAMSMAFRRKEQRDRSDLLYQALAIHGSDVVLTIDDGRITHASHAIDRVLGYWAKEVVGMHLVELIHPDDRAVVHELLQGGGDETLDMTVRAPRSDGDIRHVDLLITDHTAHQTLESVVVTMRDVTDRVVAEQRLRRQALHDSLTGLANRALALDRLEHALAQRADDPVAVLFIDLNDFKVINDGLGHAAGDRVLIVIADRLRRVVRGGDTAARLGGDEFALLLHEVASRDEAGEVAARVRAAVSAPIDLSGRRVTVSCSVGIAFAAAHSTAESLMREADTAMYAAKRDGGQGERVFQPRMHFEAVQRLEWARELPEALDNDQFELVYQPIVDLSTQQLSGVEALIRWNHPVRGVVSPVNFIPFAEDSGLILPIGQWIVEQAGRDAARLVAGMGRPVRTNVNVSARQFEVDGFVDLVGGVLDRHGLEPSALGLELTESMLMSDPESAVRTLHELKDLGSVLLIDDFGTGYCSLAYLHRFPVDVLKIDRAFISELDGHDAEGSFVEAIVGLARAQRLSTVAEGVEGADIHDKLTSIGVGSGQGWLYGRPQTIDRILADWADAPVLMDGDVATV